MSNPVTPHPVTPQLDAAAIAARNEFYGADRGPEATNEWRMVVVAALNAYMTAAGFDDATLDRIGGRQHGRHVLVVTPYKPYQ